jgi:drug/metabolite transporter (DMT)-like permease
MYPLFIGITLLKISSPYFRKHILDSLEPFDLLYINGFFMFTIISLIFLYQIIFNKTMKKTIDNYNRLTFTQIVCLFIICCMIVASTLLIFELDKNHNTPFINAICLNSGKMLLLLLISIIIFGEKYNYIQLLGVILTIIGLMMILCK